MIRPSFTSSFLVSTVAAVLASVVACVPVQPQAQQGTTGAPQAGQEVSTGPEHDQACRDACTVFDQCGKDSFDSCTGQCPTIRTERLQRFASFSCEELTAVIEGTVGSACTSYGRNDCGPMGPNFGCCGGDEATRTPGQCLDVAVCAMPTR